MIFEEIVEVVDNPKRSGEGFVANCPAHDDKTPSLSIAKGDDGRTLIKCYAGCETRAIVTKWGLKMSDLFDEGQESQPRRATRQKKPKLASKRIDQDKILRLKNALTDEARIELEDVRKISGEIIEKYEMGIASFNGEDRIAIPIRDDGGQVVDVRRWLPPAQRKDESAKILHWAKGYGGARLFPIDQLEYDDILFCEGELDALAGISAGVHAITLTAGAGAAFLKDDARRFAGKNVVILMDNDDGGRQGARKRARALAPYANSVKVAEWPTGRAERWDVTDELSKFGKASLDRIIAASALIADMLPQLPAP